MNTRIEWCVRYRRRFSDVVKIRKYETYPGAVRFAAKLLRGEAEWGELAEVQVGSRQVGPWEYGPNHAERER